MKKKLMSMIIAATFGVVMLAGCSATEETMDNTPKDAGTETAAAETDSAQKTDGGQKFGVSVKSLSNQIWAEICTTMEELAEKDGNTLTYVSCEENSAKQIEQIENFVQSGCDAILINPPDGGAVENILKEVREKGIKVMVWDDELENSDVNYNVDNYELGKMVGEEAARFINEKFTDGKCEVAVLDYPQEVALLERGNGIVDSLKENAPNAEIVAQQPAIDVTSGLAVTETILQGHPDVKVICCIGGGGALGANEALKTIGTISDDMGVFAVDGTNEEMRAIKNKEACRMSVLVTGTSPMIGEECYGILSDLVDGVPVEKEYFRDFFPVTIDNVDEYYRGE